MLSLQMWYMISVLLGLCKDWFFPITYFKSAKREIDINCSSALQTLFQLIPNNYAEFSRSCRNNSAYQLKCKKSAFCLQIMSQKNILKSLKENYRILQPYCLSCSVKSKQIEDCKQSLPRWLPAAPRRPKPSALRPICWCSGGWAPLQALPCWVLIQARESRSSCIRDGKSLFSRNWFQAPCLCHQKAFISHVFTPPTQVSLLAQGEEETKCMQILSVFNSATQPQLFSLS